MLQLSVGTWCAAQDVNTIFLSARSTQNYFSKVLVGNSQKQLIITTEPMQIFH